MKFAILGAGAMGSWFGGKLAQAGYEVQLLTTNQAHRDAINQRGLILRDDAAQGNEAGAPISVAAVHPREYTGPASVIVLLTKTFQSPVALATIQHTIDNNTYILTLQNGIGNSEIISQFIPQQRILIGNTMLPVDKVAAGDIICKGEGISYFNALDENPDPACQKLCGLLLEAFQHADIDALLDTNIHQRIWSKLAFNVGMNAVCCLAHGTPGSIADSPGAQSLVVDAAREACAIGAACGVSVDLAAVEAMIDFACQNHRDHKASMLQDLLAGRPTEVDTLNGAIVRLGKHHQVPTPVNDMLATLVKLAELSHQRYPQV